MKEKDAQTKYDKKELSYASNSVARIDDLLGSIATDWENWVYQVDENNEYPTWIGFKPLDVSAYADELLLNLGQQRILMSGTILDYDIFGRELGLKPEETALSKWNTRHSPKRTARFIHTLREENCQERNEVLNRLRSVLTLSLPSPLNIPTKRD